MVRSDSSGWFTRGLVAGFVNFLSVVGMCPPRGHCVENRLQTRRSGDRLGGAYLEQVRGDV